MRTSLLEIIQLLGAVLLWNVLPCSQGKKAHLLIFLRFTPQRNAKQLQVIFPDCEAFAEEEKEKVDS